MNDDDRFIALLVAVSTLLGEKLTPVGAQKLFQHSLKFVRDLQTTPLERLDDNEEEPDN